MYVFVGEKRSKRAKKMGVTWEDGHLSARTLHEALVSCDINPKTQLYINVFDGRYVSSKVRMSVVYYLRTIVPFPQDFWIVALGRKVSQCLMLHEIPHTRLIHPAARGSIRRTAAYQAHVYQTLKQIMNAVDLCP